MRKEEEEETESIQLEFFFSCGFETTKTKVSLRKPHDI